MLSKLFRKKKEEIDLDEHIVWGLWATRRLKMTYKTTANELQVPISVLVGHVLNGWLADNCDTILGDEQKRAEFGDFLTKKYLNGEMDE
jgi:hypothetical protein